MATTKHDPVCGMDIDPATAAGTSEYNGQTYYFCSLGCKKAFDKEPEKYLGKEHEHNHKIASLHLEQRVFWSGHFLNP